MVFILSSIKTRFHVMLKALDPTLERKAKEIVVKLFFNALNSSFSNVTMFFGLKDKTFKEMTVENTKDQLKVEKTGLVNYVNITVDPQEYKIDSILGKSSEKTPAFWSKIMTHKGNLDFIQKNIAVICKILAYSSEYVKFQLKEYDWLFFVRFSQKDDQITIKEILITGSSGERVLQVWFNEA